MKRIIPLILLLIMLLAACGAEIAPTETPEPVVTANTAPASPMDLRTPPVETPRPTQSEELLNRDVPVDLALPDTGFEVSSYWVAEPFGDGGQALLLLGGQGGEVSFECRYSEWYRYEEQTFTDMLCGCFDSTGGAEISVYGDVLTVSYPDEAEGPRPERFNRVSRDDALLAYRNSPYNHEAVTPVPVKIRREELEAIPGIELRHYEEWANAATAYTYPGARLSFNAFGDGWLHLASISSENPDFLGTARGVTIGVSADEVLARFPSDIAAFSDADVEHTLYGTPFFCWGCVSGPEDERYIQYSDGGTFVRFYLDENGLVSSITCTLEVD